MADHGGSIRAEKNVPTGTRFILEVPLASTPAESNVHYPAAAAQHA